MQYDAWPLDMSLPIWLADKTPRWLVRVAGSMEEHDISSWQFMINCTFLCRLSHEAVPCVARIKVVAQVMTHKRLEIMSQCWSGSTG